MGYNETLQRALLRDAAWERCQNVLPLPVGPMLLQKLR